MECIRGKRCYELDRSYALELLARHDGAIVDLGTGDGRFVVCRARASRSVLAIGIDSCRENLRVRSRVSPPNALFVIGRAENLPLELTGIADGITVNFPWGSLLADLLHRRSPVWSSLRMLTGDLATFELTVNAEALTSHSQSFAEGVQRLLTAIESEATESVRAEYLDRDALRAMPSTWARRLAFGRDPRAIRLRTRLGRLGRGSDQGEDGVL